MTIALWLIVKGGREKVDEVGAAATKAAGALLARPLEIVPAQAEEDTRTETPEIQSGQGGVKSTMVSVGKYLAPGLYVSFGRSLFTRGYLFIVRHASPGPEVRTTTGGETGGDIYYE